MVYGSFANCRVRTANWISVVTICSLISHLSGNNVVTRQISPTMNKDGQIHLLATIAVIRHKYIHVLCGLSYPSMLFCLLFFSLFILKTVHRNPSAFNEKDSKIENLSRALVNHDKMSFFKEKKSFFFFSPWTLSCSLAILIGCTHGKSISDFQNNALIDLKQPRSTFNRNIFFVRYLFSITISAIIIFLIVFLAFCSPLCQNDLCLSSPLTNFPPSPTYFHGCQKPLTSQKFCLFSSLKKKYLKVKRARFCLY